MLTVLRGGGWLSAHGRHSAAALIRQGDSAIMIDAQVDRLLLIHLPPFAASLEPILAEAGQGFGAVAAAEDGLALEALQA